MALHLNKLESRSPWNVMCQVWVKLAQWFYSKYFRVRVFSLLVFRYYLYLYPLKKDGGLPLNKHEFLSPKIAWCQVWLKLALWFWTQDENFPFSQLKHFWMSNECSRKVHWNPDFRHYSVTFQWTFSPTECCWIAGKFQWPFSYIFFISWKKNHQIRGFKVIKYGLRRMK